MQTDLCSLVVEIVEALDWLLLGGRNDKVLVDFDQTLVLELFDGCLTVLKSCV